MMLKLSILAASVFSAVSCADSETVVSGIIRLVDIGPIMKPFHIQFEWMLVTSHPVSNSPSVRNVSSMCEATRARYFAALEVPYNRESAATRQTEREASDPNSAAGVPLPEHPAVPAFPLVL